MTDTNGAGGPETEIANFSPPYTSFRTLLNLIERMASEGGVPSRVDRSYLSNLPGSSQTMLLKGLKSLWLIDGDAQPTEDLVALVNDPDSRAGIVAEMIKMRYTRPLELGRNATQQQLEEAFRSYGISGSTLRKAIAFFLAAAKYAEIPLSPHFRTPRAPGAERPRRTSGARRTGERSATSEKAEGTDGRPDQMPAGYNPFVGPMDAAPALIQDLVKQLPPEGSPWEKTKAEKWLGIAALTFEMVYDLNGPVEAPKLSPEPTEGGDTD